MHAVLLFLLDANGLRENRSSLMDEEGWEAFFLYSGAPASKDFIVSSFSYFIYFDGQSGEPTLVNADNSL